MSVTRQAENWALCAADAEPPRTAAPSDAMSTVTTASAASVSQRFLTMVNPPCSDVLLGGLAGVQYPVLRAAPSDIQSEATRSRSCSEIRTRRGFDPSYGEM